LKKVSFRPYEEDWVELGRMASLAGTSRCFMFITLFIRDLEQRSSISRAS
jgi:hypothetical protein